MERIALGIIMLLLIVLIGLAMTVALRQVNAHVAGVDFSAAGGGEAPAAIAMAIAPLGEKRSA